MKDKKILDNTEKMIKHITSSLNKDIEELRKLRKEIEDDIE